MIQRLRDSIKDVTRRVGEMDASAKLLVGAILVILTMGLFLVSQYAASPAMTTVRVDPTKASTIAVLDTIRSHGYQAEDAGDGLIRVAARDKAKVVRYIEESGVSVEAEDPSTPATDSGFMPSEARLELHRLNRVAIAERAIEANPRIRNAIVQVSGGTRRTFGVVGPERTVTVTVVPRSGTVDQLLADSIAAIAATVEDGTGLEKVTVVDQSAGGRTFRFDDSGHGGRLDYPSQVRSWERHITSKIRGVINRVFPQADVAVSIAIDLSDRESTKQGFEKPEKGDVATLSEETSTPTPAAGSGTPGFTTNAGTGAGSVLAAGGQSAKTSRERTITDQRFGSTTEVQSEHANYPVNVNASVILPTQGIEEMIRKERGGEGEVTPEEIEARVASLQVTVANIVQPLVATEGFRNGTLGEVVVNAMPFADYLPVASIGAGTEGVGGMIDGMAGGRAVEALKNAGLVGLALVSLAMMFMMVRRSGGSAVLPSAEELAGVPPVLEDDAAEVVGEAEEAAPALVGVELDDDELRRKQMLDQLNQLVKNEPAEVASLLRRWMRAEA